MLPMQVGQYLIFDDLAVVIWSTQTACLWQKLS